MPGTVTTLNLALLLAAGICLCSEPLRSQPSPTLAETASAGCRSTQSIPELLADGRLHLFRNRPDAALSLFTCVLQRDPHNVQALYESAWAYFDMMEFTESLESATEATLYESTMFDQLYALISANYYYDMIVAVYEIQLEERSQEEIAMYKQLSFEAPDGVDRFFKLGVGYRVRGESDSAVVALLNALKLDPAYGNAHLEVAGVLERTARPAEAGLAYARALALGVETPFADRIVARLENCLHRFDGSDSAVATHPRESVSWIAERLSRLGRLPDDGSELRGYYGPWMWELESAGHLTALAERIYTSYGNRPISTEFEVDQEALRIWDQLYQWPGAEYRTYVRADMEEDR